MKPVVAVLIVLGALSTGCASHPSDREMIDLFNAHRSEFQWLADEAVADVRNVEKDEYQRRLDALGLEQAGLGNQAHGEVTFTMSSDSSKGFLHTPTVPDRVLDSLDGDAVKPYAYAYRRIDDHWYLYLYRD